MSALQDWLIKEQMLSRGLQDQQQSKQQFPNTLREQDTINEMRRLLIEQSGKSFPTQLEGEQLKLQAAREGYPAVAFKRDVDAFGPNAGARSFVNRNPGLAEQLWGGAPEARSGFGEGPPDLVGMAQNSAQNLYTGGPETAAKTRVMEESFPFQKEMANILGQWGVAQHAASKDNSMDLLREKAKKEAAGAAAAMINQSPASVSFQAMQEAIVNAKDRAGADAIMKSMSAVSQQLAQVGKNAFSTGVAMGGDPHQLKMMIDEQINSMRNTLSAQYKELVDKFYTNAPPTFGEKVRKAFSTPTSGMGSPDIMGVNPFYQE